MLRPVRKKYKCLAVKLEALLVTNLVEIVFVTQNMTWFRSSKAGVNHPWQRSLFMVCLPRGHASENFHITFFKARSLFVRLQTFSKEAQTAF